MDEQNACIYMSEMSDESLKHEMDAERESRLVKGLSCLYNAALHFFASMWKGLLK